MDTPTTIPNSASSPQPPPYEAVDSSTPEGTVAVNIAKRLIAQCKTEGGQLDKHKLSRILDMTVRHIQHETGILPSVATASANSPTNNNPRNFDESKWNNWETCLFKGGSFSNSSFLTQHSLASILGANIDDYQKFSALVSHDAFKNSFSCKLESHVLKNMFHKRNQDGCDLLISLFQCLSTARVCKPIGIIQAAIELGYLPQEDIQKILHLG